MMEQSLNGMFRPSSLDARCDERRQALPDVPHNTVVPSRRDNPYRAAVGDPADSRGHRTVVRPRPFAAGVARAQRAPAQGHRPQTRGRWLRVPKAILAPRLKLQAIRIADVTRISVS